MTRLQSLSSALSGQALIDYMGSHLRVNYFRSAAGDDIVLTNSGPLDIPPGGQWSIYFNHAGTNHHYQISFATGQRTIIFITKQRFMEKWSVYKVVLEQNFVVGLKVLLMDFIGISLMV